MKFKVFVLDPLAVRIARTILKRMTASIVQWINSGYQGSPSYLTNPNKFFADIAKEETNIFIIQEVAKSNNPYATDIVYSILNPRKGVYSLYDDIAYNCVLRGEEILARPSWVARICAKHTPGNSWKEDLATAAGRAGIR